MTGKRSSSREDATNKLRQMFGKLGEPPSATLALDNLDTPARHARKKSDRVEQLNARVPKGTKRRVKTLATRDGITGSEVVERALKLYEEKYGAAPEL